MAMLCSAYGMRLDSSFPIAGMASSGSADPGLPILTLGLAWPDELAARWRPAGGQEQWRGRLGDGMDLVIQTAGEDVLFSYGDRADFLLHERMARLDCAPRGEGLDWQRTLISKVIPAISVMRGYEALHAAAVESRQGVVAIMAPTGAGKSTLAAELMSRGWPLFADDVLVLADEDGAVIAHPGSAHMNVAERLPEPLEPEMLGESIAVLAGELWMSARNVSSAPRPVRALCLLERSGGLDLAAEVLPSGPLLLAPYMLGLSTAPERQRSRFDLYADLMESCTLVRLTAAPEHRPSELADLIERVLESAPRAMAGEMR